MVGSKERMGNGREIEKEEERGRLEEEEEEEMVGRETERKRERKGRKNAEVLIPSKSTIPSSRP